MQATQQGPVAMVFDEFASLIGQPTIVSDASGTSVTNTLINAQVEVVPNISVTGTFQLGSVLSLELHDEPGHPFRVFGCLQAANYNLNSIMGTVFVDFLHPSFRTIATGTTSAGPSLMNLNLPANPSLSGVTAHIQATSGANSDQRMTNSCSFVLQ
jgi:hypothetical protein